MNGSYPSPCSHIILLIINVAMSRFIGGVICGVEMVISWMIDRLDHVDQKNKTKKIKKVTFW